MSDSRTIIAANLARVRERVARVAGQVGRDEAGVRLVGVTKYVEASAAADLLAAGCTDLGESRPQELWNKAADPRLRDARWHLVGHLQRNKINRTLPLVALIHSMDSGRLLRAIHERAAVENRIVDVLLEVNCSGDAAKHGLTAEETRSLVDELEQYANVRVGGLMTMAPLQGGRTAARRAFAALRSLREELQQHCLPGTSLDELSMGMSGDLEEAIAEGATIVRIGTALFEGLSR